MSATQSLFQHLDLREKMYKPVCERHFPGSLGAPWWRIHLPRQEIWVQSLIWEDPTCRRATKPVHHSYEPVLWSPGVTATDLHAAASDACMPWSCAPQKGSHCHQRLSQRLERSPRSPQPEKSSDINKEQAQPKVTWINAYDHVLKKRHFPRIHLLTQDQQTSYL